MQYYEPKYAQIILHGSLITRPGTAACIVLLPHRSAKGGIKPARLSWQARQKSPHLVCSAVAFPALYVLFPKKREIYYRFTPKVEPYGLDEAWLDMTGTGRTRRSGGCDPHHRQGGNGLTVSVGASFNKVFAKLGSDMAGPDEAAFITRENYKETVWPLAVEDLLFVGRSTKRKLEHRRFDIGDLANLSPRCCAPCWASAARCWAPSPGEDRSKWRSWGCAAGKVHRQQPDPFSGFENEEDVKQMFFILSESVSARLRDQGWCAIWWHQRADCELNSFTRQSVLQKPTALSGEIANAALRLFCANYGWAKPVRSVGVWAGRLSAADGRCS